MALKDAQSKFQAAGNRLAAGVKEQESLRAQLKLHTLTAPIAGRVGRLLVVRGQTLAVGTPVADVVDLDEQIDVLCFVPPSLVGKLKLGQPARSGGFDDPARGGRGRGRGRLHRRPGRAGDRELRRQGAVREHARPACGPTACRESAS